MTTLQRLVREGEAAYREKLPKKGRRGAIKTFRLKRGVKLEGAVRRGRK
jgi:hypothetical protein